MVTGFKYQNLRKIPVEYERDSSLIEGLGYHELKHKEILDNIILVNEKREKWINI